MERPRHPVLLYTLILLMVIGWSFNFIIAKITLRYINPYALTSFRIVLSGILMLPIYFARPRRSRLNREDLWNFAVLGFFGVVINRGLFIVGLDYTTAGHSALIVATGPILVLLLARAYKLEKVTRAKIAGMTICFAGIAVLVAGEELRHHAGTWIGDVIALGGTTGFALYTVLAKKVARQYDTISMNTFCNLAGAIFLLPMSVREAARLDWRAVGTVGWLGLGYTVLISSIGAYLIFFWALSHLPASRLAVFTYLEPPLGALLAVVLLGENLTNALLIGGGLILAGVYLAEFGPGRAQVPAETAGA
ncbi:MAG: EamA family transporter [Candidatus Acidiferrales bacterium]